MRNPLKLVFFVALISASFSTQAATVGNLFSVLMGKSNAHQSETGIDNVLTKVTEQMNKRLPAAVDSDTRLDSVSAVPGQHFIYNYTLLTLNGNQVNPDDFHNTIKPQLKTRLCNSVDMQNFLKNGVTISYLYKGKDGQPIGGAKFTPSDCGYKPL